jgi:hypothetical protein
MSDETKFTQGERKVTEYTTRGTFHISVTAGDVTVAHMECPADDAEAVAATRADAALDAAAPEMYEALREAVENPPACMVYPDKPAPREVRFGKVFTTGCDCATCERWRGFVAALAKADGKREHNSEGHS